MWPDQGSPSRLRALDQQQIQGVSRRSVNTIATAARCLRYALEQRRLAPHQSPPNIVNSQHPPTIPSTHPDCQQPPVQYSATVRLTGASRHRHPETTGSVRATLSPMTTPSCGFDCHRAHPRPRPQRTGGCDPGHPVHDARPTGRLGMRHPTVSASRNPRTTPSSRGGHPADSRSRTLLHRKGDRDRGRGVDPRSRDLRAGRSLYGSRRVARRDRRPGFHRPLARHARDDGRQRVFCARFAHSTRNSWCCFSSTESSASRSRTTTRGGSLPRAVRRSKASSISLPFAKEMISSPSSQCCALCSSPTIGSTSG